MWKSSYEQCMPPKDFDLLVVKGEKSFEIRPKVFITVTFYALIGNDSDYSIYDSQWCRSLLGASIVEVHPRIDLDGDDVRPYNVASFIPEDQWFFTLDNVTEWRKIKYYEQDDE